MFKKWILLLLMFCGFNLLYGTTIEIYNKTTNKDLMLYFLNGGKDENNVNLKGIPTPQKYLQPWESGKLKLTEPYICSYESIESQTLWYLLGNKDDPSFIQDLYDKGIAPGNGAPWWLGGFFEFSKLPGNKNYWDMTNVDQIGLFAGFDDGRVKWGYKITPVSMISKIKSAYPTLQGAPPKSPTHPGQNLPSALTTVNVGDKTYQKLQGPTDDWAYYYTSLPVKYLEEVKTNGIEVTLAGDATHDNSNPHCGEQMDAFIFEGKFYNGNYKAPAGVTLPGDLKAEDVVLAVTCVKPPAPCKKAVTVFYTKDAICGKTILCGNSPAGVYVHNAVQVGTGGGNVQDKEWASNVGLNWTTGAGPTMVYDTSCFQAMINSLARDIIIGFNDGRIPTKSGSKYDSSTKPAIIEEPQYVNLWNKTIVSNSDSYGMAYSDGSGKSKVLYHPAADATVKVYVFAPDDKGVSAYYTPPK